MSDGQYHDRCREQTNKTVINVLINKTINRWQKNTRIYLYTCRRGEYIYKYIFSAAQSVARIAVNENETRAPEFVDQPPLTYCYGCGRPEPTLEGVNVADAGLNQWSGRQPPAGQRFATVFPCSTAVPPCCTIGHRTFSWLQARQTDWIWCLWSRLVSYRFFYTVLTVHHPCKHKGLFTLNISSPTVNYSMSHHVVNYHLMMDKFLNTSLICCLRLHFCTFCPAICSRTYVLSKTFFSGTVNCLSQIDYQT